MLTELNRIYQAQADAPNFRPTRLTEADIQRWSASVGEPRTVLYDQIAIY